MTFALIASPALQAEESQPRHLHSLTDMTGRTVEVLAPLHNVADLWFAHNAVTIMLGGAETITVTVVNPQNQPWMFKVAPSLHKATLADSTNPNVEVLKRSGVEAAFLFNNAAALPALQRMDIPVVQAGFTNLPSLLKAVTLTADALGTEQAKIIATRYVSFVHDKTEMITQTVAPVMLEDRPRVLHITSLAPIKIDGTNTIIEEWIKTAGGRIATEISGNMKQVSLEEIVAMNPDVIILAGAAGAFDPERATGLWQNIRAVKDRRVYRNPMGVFPWDRYGPEFALQIQWAAKTLYADRFKDLDMKEETIRFYREFFNYPLTDLEAERILMAEPPLDPAP